MNIDSTVKEPIRVRYYTWMLFCLWSLIIGVSLSIGLFSLHREFQALARMEALAAFNKDLVYRRWAAQHGGVYAPISKITPPNPYLSHVPERDIRTPSGRALTLVNPAYMTRQVHQLGLEQYGLRGHITSLKVLRPENAPDPWEKDALEALEQGRTEVTSLQEIQGEAYFRLMRPLITEESCLKCHGELGYKVGDMRGGISVSVPMGPYRAAARSQTIYHVLGHLLVWMVGLAGIYVGMRRLRQRIGEIKTLRGLLPICAFCKKIRDDRGYWNQIESYIHRHSEVDFSHGICPECMKKHYPELGESE